VTSGIAGLIDRRASVREVEALAIQEGMQTLLAAGVARAIAGDTTFAEVRDRVLVWEETERHEKAEVTVMAETEGP